MPEKETGIEARLSALEKGLADLEQFTRHLAKAAAEAAQTFAKTQAKQRDLLMALSKLLGHRRGATAPGTN